MIDKDTLAVVATCITTVVSAASAVYARHKGRKREPQMKKLLDCTEHIDQAIEKHVVRFDRIEARLQRIEVAMAKNGISDPDDHPETPDPL